MLLPHSKQNLLPAGFAVPQLGQELSNLFPHSLQNLATARFSKPHFGHFILLLDGGNQRNVELIRMMTEGLSWSTRLIISDRYEDPMTLNHNRSSEIGQPMFYAAIGDVKAEAFFLLNFHRQVSVQWDLTTNGASQTQNRTQDAGDNVNCLMSNYPLLLKL
jgi:hypothetical protein